MSKTISVTCPHCAATLEFDSQAGVVVGHQPPASKERKIDFETRMQEMEDEKRRAEGRLNEAMRAEQSRERLLEDRFRQLMDKAGDVDDKTPHIRDIDLD